MNASLLHGVQGGCLLAVVFAALMTVGWHWLVRIWRTQVHFGQKHTEYLILLHRNL